MQQNTRNAWYIALNLLLEISNRLFLHFHEVSIQMHGTQASFLQVPEVQSLHLVDVIGNIVITEDKSNVSRGDVNFPYTYVDVGGNIQIIVVECTSLDFSGQSAGHSQHSTILKSVHIVYLEIATIAPYCRVDLSAFRMNCNPWHIFLFGDNRSNESQVRCMP